MSGTLSLVVDQLRFSLADSTTFRALTNAAGRDAALERIYLHNLPEPEGSADHYAAMELDSLRPYALIFLPPNHQYSQIPDAMGSHREYRSGGRLALRISRAVPGGMSRDQADQDWVDQVSKIIDDLCDRSGDGSDSYLWFDSLRITDGPGRHLPDYDPAQGEEQGVDLEVAWGESGGRQG